MAFPVADGAGLPPNRVLLVQPCFRACQALGIEPTCKTAKRRMCILLPVRDEMMEFHHHLVCRWLDVGGARPVVPARRHRPRGRPYQPGRGKIDICRYVPLQVRLAVSRYRYIGGHPRCPATGTPRCTISGTLAVSRYRYTSMCPRCVIRDKSRLIFDER